MSSASTGGTEGSSPSSSPASAASQAMSAPKYGTLVPNRIFVGGISASTSEAELAQLFSAYGNVKATKIISDRAGVSKGYGFVTFETEEEAKRLQQESECIILRERKLNIAPAIKKQPFNRSFDGGSGSPPAVPTSPYYYTNGMGLPYQNGLTFYNAGAPAPGTPLAPPTDPTAIYQAAGVFGPQAASAHQTYAPMMYPCPAPSLAYMPQQYQYSPMPYESYYAGAAGAPQYIYATSTPTSNGSGGGGVGGGGGSSTGGGNGATGATSPATTVQHGLQSLPPAPPHYYATSGPPTGAPTHHHHHHHQLQNGPGTPQQLDHPYYSYTAAGPPHQPPPHSHPQQPPPPPPQQQQHGGHIGLGDQQLLLFTTDATCQQSANSSDGQAISQEDTRSASSHSEHQSQPQSGSNNNNETTHLSTPSTPLIPLMPIKYPISNRYTNYHPLTLHPQNSPMCPTTQTTTTDTEDAVANPMHCRAIIYHPVFIPNPYNTPGASLLPTPPGTFDTSKMRDSINHTNKSPYNHGRNQNNYNLYSTMHQNALTKSTTKFTLSRANNPHNRRNNSNITPPCYVTRSTNSSLSYKSPNTFVNARHNGDIYSSPQSSSSNTRRNLNSDFSMKRNNNSYINNTKHNTHDNINHNNDVTCKSEAGNNTDNKSLSPPPAPYSPMTRPLPNLSPPNLQVQFYTAQSRYQSQSQHNHHHHQQPQQQQHQQQQQQPHQFQQQQRRYGTTMSSQIGSSGRKSTDKFNTPGGQGVMLRNNKFKVNGMMQNAGKAVEEGLGGAGDAQQTVGRMPLTPPGTPRNLQDSNQINDACHQIQALTL